MMRQLHILWASEKMQPPGADGEICLAFAQAVM